MSVVRELEAIATRHARAAGLDKLPRTRRALAQYEQMARGEIDMSEEMFKQMAQAVIDGETEAAAALAQARRWSRA